MPGKPSPLKPSGRLYGVAVGSTETTDRIGNTRSETLGLNGPKRDSESCSGLCEDGSVGFSGSSEGQRLDLGEGEDRGEAGNENDRR